MFFTVIRRGKLPSERTRWSALSGVYGIDEHAGQLAVAEKSGQVTLLTLSESGLRETRSWPELHSGVTKCVRFQGSPETPPSVFASAGNDKTVQVVWFTDRAFFSFPLLLWLIENDRWICAQVLALPS